MPPSPTQSPEDALLTRLNALKKSPITLSTTPTLLSTSGTSPARTTPAATDDLAARFSRLGSPSPASSPQPKSSAPNPSSQAPAIAPGASSYLEGVAEGIGGGTGMEVNEEDERSLDDLIKELAEKKDGEEGWEIGKGEDRDIRGLAREVRRLVDERREEDKDRSTDEFRRSPGRTDNGPLVDWENVEVDVGRGRVGALHDGEHEDDEEGDEKKKTEDEEADDIIARIMDELSLGKAENKGEEEQTQDAPPTVLPQPSKQEDTPQNHTSTSPSPSPQNRDTPHSPPKTKTDTDTPESALDLPSAPGTVPQSSSPATQSLEDALTARFASLFNPNAPTSPPTTHIPSVPADPSSTTHRKPGDAFALPSAPSFAPATKPPSVSTNVFLASRFADDDIDSWCVICNDDATLRCLGCEGDLYCRDCWMEGHRGEGAGLEERRHRAVEFVKPDSDSGGKGGKEKRRMVGVGG